MTEGGRGRRRRLEQRLDAVGRGDRVDRDDRAGVQFNIHLGFRVGFRDLFRDSFRDNFSTSAVVVGHYKIRHVSKLQI